MSSQFDLEETDTEFAELLEAEDVRPEAFYLALKQALTQLEHHASAYQAA